jgi:hypothetical protein
MYRFLHIRLLCAIGASVFSCITLSAREVDSLQYLLPEVDVVEVVLPVSATSAAPVQQVSREAIDRLGYATVTDASELRYLAECWSGEKFSGAEIDPTLKPEKYELKLEASNLKGIYYCLTYWRFTADVLIYEDIDSPDGFVPTYSVDYTLHTYDNGSHYVAYNFGREILYNRTTDEACAIDQTLAKYLVGGAGA